VFNQSINANDFFSGIQSHSMTLLSTFNFRNIFPYLINIIILIPLAKWR